MFCDRDWVGDLQNAMAMLVTARKAPVKPSWRVTSMLPDPMGRSAATSPRVINMAKVMEMQANSRGQQKWFLRDTKCDGE